MCSFDAKALAAMARKAEQTPRIFDAPQPDHPADVLDPESGANLIAFTAARATGTNPVWISRTVDGAVVFFVADMLVV